MDNIKKHHEYLRQAINLAREGMRSGNPPFASLIVVDDIVRATAFNTSKSDKNFLNHGEINLLVKARAILSTEEFQRATFYAGNEPCPMCSGAIYWSGVRSLVYGSSRDALTKVRQFGLNVPCREIVRRGPDNFTVIGPMLEDEVMPLYAEFYGKGEDRYS